MATMEVHNIDVCNLLVGFKVYQLPFFQRSYVWPKSRWEMLFDDIEQTHRKIKTGKADTEYKHFLGSILTVPQPPKANGITFYQVVDGQQRLVTLTLILCAIRDIAKEYLDSLSSKTKAKSQTLEQICDTSNVILLNNYPSNYRERCKVFPTRIDCPAYFRIVDFSRDWPDLISPYNQQQKYSLVEAAYQFFKEKIKEWLEGSKFFERRLEEFQRTLLDNLVVAHVTLSRAEEAYRIYESLNTKGVPLTQVDLIRNYLFMNISEKCQEDSYYKYWKPLEERYQQSFPSDDEEGVTHLEKLSDAIWYYTRLSGKDVPRQDAYAALKELHENWLRQKDDSTKGKKANDIISDKTIEFMRKLVDILQKYLDVVDDKTANKKLARKKDTLKLLAFGSFTPFVMAIISQVEDENIADSLLSLIETYYIHRIIAGLSNRSLDDLSIRILHAQVLKQPNPVASLQQILIEQKGQTRWPSRDEIANGLASTALEDYALFILKRLEEHLRGKEAISFGDKITLEHILPKKPSKGWQQDLGDDWQSIHKRWLKTLPNLTLTGYNSEMGNKPYPEKLQFLRDKTNLAINHLYFGQNPPEKWDEAALQHRCDWLLEQILKVWPLPSPVAQ
ncbi:MAG: DUF262 domain-containing HNH endonuclease family protein [Gloeomargarita sp. SKYG116]|nr:DUF262 domain-containing HNH endonuclease family protein [Gloeomargarita sp. SKYG116]MDW8401510.1 DUF262 domain-containing protein [Gloeomargarita sp. SKYGB_i_bin116]